MKFHHFMKVMEIGFDRVLTNGFVIVAVGVHVNLADEDDHDDVDDSRVEVGDVESGP
jgi:hypothetical protein